MEGVDCWAAAIIRASPDCSLDAPSLIEDDCPTEDVGECRPPLPEEACGPLGWLGLGPPPIGELPSLSTVLPEKNMNRAKLAWERK